MNRSKIKENIMEMKTPVTVHCDGRECTADAGSQIRLCSK